MTRAGRVAISLALTLATAGAPAPAPDPVIAPALVLQRYADALAKLERPPSVTFEFSVEQFGTRNLSEMHRVYRSGLRERDEALVLDGTALKTPQVRISSERADPYDVRAVAPKPAEYVFTYAGQRTTSGRTVYAFRTQSVRLAVFTVSDVLIDAQRFLPLAIAFRSRGAAGAGTGHLVFASAARYWVIREANVSAELGGKTARERILWTRYRFPAALPVSTFSLPRPLPLPLPSASP